MSARARSPAYKRGNETKEARESCKWLTWLDVAVRKLERAETEEEKKAAPEFARDVLLDEPVREQ